MSQAPPNATGPLRTAPVPGDANDTRGRHFKQLLRSRAAVLGGSTAIFVAFVAVGLAVSPLYGVLAALVAALMTVVICFAVADSRAEDDFFRTYSEARGLRWDDEHGDVPPVTPLLRKGDKRRTDLELHGRWPNGFEGQLAHYTYTEVTRDSKGRRQETDYDFTVTLTEVPEVAPFLKELSAQRRAGFRFLDGAEDAFRSRQRVEHESEALDKRFEIFIDEDDDMNRALQVLEPSFVVWLSEHTPDDFAFECIAGTLCTAVRGHKGNAVELDELTEASVAVAARLREEATE
ncbi:hypothetical protein HJD18_06280 [Thermoleophilia bacterium SCSIO 60948]|nr:hypothetical protein HJD18_06280 [Thermoleophilia bacterium SCSIO 60948]